jgi:hypothetical protein
MLFAKRRNASHVRATKMTGQNQPKAAAIFMVPPSSCGNPRVAAFNAANAQVTLSAQPTATAIAAAVGTLKEECESSCQNRTTGSTSAVTRMTFTENFPMSPNT